MRVTVRAIVIGEFVSAQKCVKRRPEDVQIGDPPRHSIVRIRTMRRAQETWGELLSIILQWKVKDQQWCERLARSELIIIIIIINSLLRAYKGGWKSYKAEEESKRSKLQHSPRRCTGTTGSQRKKRNHPHCSIVKIGQNTDKSPGDRRRLPVFQTPVKDHHLALGVGGNSLVARRPHIIIIKKRTCRIVDFAVSADQRVKLKESEKKDKYLDLAWELKKKTVEHGSDCHTNSNWCFWYSHQRISKTTGELGNNWTSGDYPNYSIAEIGQNTELSPGDLRRIVVTQTPMWNHRLTPMWKSQKIVVIIVHTYISTHWSSG